MIISERLVTRMTSAGRQLPALCKAASFTKCGFAILCGLAILTGALPCSWAQDAPPATDKASVDLSSLNVPEVPAELAAPPKASGESTTAAPTGDAATGEAAIEEASSSPPSTSPADISEEPASPFSKKRSFGFGSLPSLRPSAPMTLNAEYTLAADGKSGQLSVIASLNEPWHTYSTTQPAGGPKRSVIKVTTPGVTAKEFKSDAPPKVSKNDLYPGVAIEEHHQRVVWTAAIELPPDFTPDKSELTIAFDGLVCSDVCQEVNETVVAKLVTAQTPVALEAFRAKNTHADLTAYMEPADMKAGGQAEIVIQAKLDRGFHIYQFVPGNTDSQFKTLMVPTKEADLQWGKPLTTGKLHTTKLLGDDISYYEGDVEWRIPIRVPADAAEGEREIEIALGYMTCTDQSCDPPAGAIVTGKVRVVSAPGAANRVAFQVSNAKSNLAAKQANLGSWIDFDSGNATEPAAEDAKPKAISEKATGGLVTGRLSMMTILFALGGGFILNFMPCVLPVIGLKVLGFVEQAGSARGEIVKLNLAYVLGVCTVMWVLASITVATQNSFGWGEQFTKFEFKLAMATLVFAMALSFLGVWEIPIPGFATSYKSAQLMEREGALGAFSKGLFTTILATPCSGPLLGFVFAVSVTLDPVGVFVVYTMIGLGMGLPFLVLCLNPSFVKLLPKPGAWMQTLKEALSFPLLLTVVYFVAAIGPGYRIATFSTLIAVWFACWLIGKVPIYADRHVKVKTWSAAIASAVVWGMISFAWLGPIDTKLPWKPYSPITLNELRKEGKTVMIDFTANWCANCQLNTFWAIETESVVEMVKKNGVVPLLADKTEASPEIDAKLVELSGTNVIPFLVIYPADPKAEPIILNGTFTKDKLVEALKDAGPSNQEKATSLTSYRQ